MRAMRCLPSPHAASCFGPNSSDGTAAKSDAENVVNVPIYYGTTGKEVAVREFHSQSYIRQKVLLTIIQVDNVRSPLRAVFQTHEDRFVESSKTYRN